MRYKDPELSSNWGTICTPVKMEVLDEKKRQIQAADTKGILRIIQSIPSIKAEPFKLWLAEVGAERINETIAKRGGKVAGDARKAIEQDTGRPVITSKNAIDFTNVIELVNVVTESKENK